MRAQRAFRARRGHLEVVATFDQVRVVEERAHDAADTLAILDGDRLAVVDRDSQRASGLARLVE